MPRLVTLLVATVCLVVASCDRAQRSDEVVRAPGEAVTGIRYLSGPEIEDALAERALVTSSSTDQFVGSHIWETFCDGTWTMIGARAPIYGRYVIEGDQFCRFAGTSVTAVCRRLAVDGEGRYFVGAIGSVELIPVGLEPSGPCPL